MELIARLVIAVLLIVTGAVFHERDIQRQCTETGHAGKSAWFGDFNCQKIKK